MRYFIFILAGLLFAVARLAAQNSATIIGAAGSSTTNGGITLGFTVGEVVVAYQEAVGAALSQGFWLPEPDSSVSVEAVGQDFEITCWPNPFSDNLEIEWENRGGNPLLFALFDLNGRLVFQKTEAATTGRSAFNETSGLPAGQYLLSVRDLGGELFRTFKVMKKG